MKKSFAYSNYVTGNLFCNHKKEQQRLMRYIEASQNLLLYSHRRHGKSSLIYQVFQNIKVSCKSFEKRDNCQKWLAKIL